MPIFLALTLKKEEEEGISLNFVLGGSCGNTVVFCFREEREREREREIK
jgi:hypothetical protein